MKTRLLPIACLCLGAYVWAHDQNRGLEELSLTGKKISIEYGRPHLKGRDMLGQAQEGMVWRMGADAATTLTTEAELVFGERVLAPGQYTLFARKEAEDRWTLLLNSEPGVTVGRRDPGRDVAEIPLRKEESDSSVEQFTIRLEATGDEGGRFSMSWGNALLSADFTVR